MSDVTAPPRSYHDRDERALAALRGRLIWPSATSWSTGR